MEEERMSKTDQAIAALKAAHPMKNRGHAFVVLKEAGLTGSGRVFNAAVAAYEAEFGVSLGKSAGAKRAEQQQALRAQAHQMSAEEVKEHIAEIDGADQLFWAAWKVFRHEGKWANKLTAADFAVHFSG